MSRHEVWMIVAAVGVSIGCATIATSAEAHSAQQAGSVASPELQLKTSNNGSLASYIQRKSTSSVGGIASIHLADGEGGGGGGGVPTHGGGPKPQYSSYDTNDSAARFDLTQKSVVASGASHSGADGGLANIRLAHLGGGQGGAVTHDAPKPEYSSYIVNDTAVGFDRTKVEYSAVFSLTKKRPAVVA